MIFSSFNVIKLRYKKIEVQLCVSYSAVRGNIIFSSCLQALEGVSSMATKVSK